MQVGAFFEIYDLKMTMMKPNMKDICNLCQLNYLQKKMVNGKQVLMAGFRDYSLEEYICNIKSQLHSCIYSGKIRKGFKRNDEIYSPGTLHNDEYGNISNNTMAIWMEDVSIRNKRKIIYGGGVINIVTGKSYIYEYETPYLFEPTSFDDLERIVSVFNPWKSFLFQILKKNKVNPFYNILGLLIFSFIIQILIENVKIV